MAERIQNCFLFSEFTLEELRQFRENAEVKQFAKNQIIWQYGTPAKQIGVVLEGCVRIETQDYWGNRSILAKISAFEVFGEAFYCAHISARPVQVCSDTDTKILFFGIPEVPEGNCRTQFLEKLLQVTAGKNVMLADKMRHITKRTIREKLLSYLSAQAGLRKDSRFTIPFNRQELADFLAVDRSALSKELGKLQAEGVLQFKKNHFTLLKSSEAD